MVALEKQINDCILSQKKWTDLDNRMRDVIGSSQEYDKKIIKYSIENQLRYRGNIVRTVINNEQQYYQELLKYSRNHLMLFPYHLSDFIISAMRVTPFQYYLFTMAHIIEQEKSYDTLPNFTAADCLRLLGIGRNQYIDIMNQSRSSYKKILGFGVRKSARNLLPQKPNENINIEPWWFINAGYITEDDVRTMVSVNEKRVIDRLITSDGISNQILAMDVDERYVRSLYLKGLIYLDVPIYDDDLIVVPPLEGFVMNRVTGDYFETLLYKIFVSIDQNTPVIELANILDIDIRLVKNAVSMYCRLGFAHKRNLYIDTRKCHPTWMSKLDEYQRLGINIIRESFDQPNKDITHFMSQLASIETGTDSGTVVDDCPSSPTELCQSLDSQLAKSIPYSPSTLLGNLTISSSSQHNSILSSSKRIVFLYDSNLAAFLMMGNMSSQLKNHAVTMFEVGKLPDESIDSLLYELSKIKSNTFEDDGFEAKRYYTHALMLHKTIEFLRTDSRLVTDILVKNNDSDNSDKQTKIGLDLVRVESLSNLDARSCQRLLKKNYQLVISSAPMNQEVGLEAVTGLPNLGPGSPLINSLWFRLFMYHITGFGPPSILLARGHRLNHLPAIFLDQEFLLITAWSREPTCVSPASALLAINDAAAHFPVLVQAYPANPIGGNMSTGDEKVFLPLPLIDDDCIDGHDDNENKENECSLRLAKIPALTKLGEQLDLRRICGYITLLKPASLLKQTEDTNKLSINNTTDESKQSKTDAGAKILAKSNGKSDEEDENSADEETEKKDDKESTQIDKTVVAESERASKRCKLDEYQLFDCTFGVPLFDEFLNKQVRNRISACGLCASESLDKLVESTRELNTKLGNFLREFCVRTSTKFADDSGDQRHFFAFPDSEQFKCPIERPAENLIFANGKLSKFDPLQG